MPWITIFDVSLLFWKQQSEVIVGNSAQEDCFSSVLFHKTMDSEDLRWRIVSLIHIYDVKFSQILTSYNDDMICLVHQDWVCMRQ